MKNVINLAGQISDTKLLADLDAGNRQYGTRSAPPEGLASPSSASFPRTLPE